MTAASRQSEQARIRREQVLALVEELNSVQAAAEQLGISQQRVRKIIGPGVFRVTHAVTCQDCGRPARVRRTDLPRCPRCKRYFDKHGRPWSRGAMRDTRRALRKTHCKRGHPFSGDNLYVSPKGQVLCRACQADRDRQYRARKASGDPASPVGED